MDWGGIKLSLNVFKEGCALQIGAYSTAIICGDPWLPNLQGHRIPDTLQLPPRHRYFIDLMNCDDKSWDISRIRQLFPLHISKAIIDTPILEPEHERLIWTPSSSGEFSVKSAYGFIIKERLQKYLNLFLICGRNFRRPTCMEDTVCYIETYFRYFANS